MVDTRPAAVDQFSELRDHRYVMKRGIEDLAGIFAPGFQQRDQQKQSRMREARTGTAAIISEMGRERILQTYEGMIHFPEWTAWLSTVGSSE